MTNSIKAKNDKRESKTKGGLYQRDGKWYISCIVNGKRYRKCIGPDKAKAKAVLAEIKAKRTADHVTGEMSGVEALFTKKNSQDFC